MYDYIENDLDISKDVNMKYREYPNHIDHWNPDHENYVYDEIHEHRLKSSIKSHNDIIDNFKKDLKLQKEVLAAIQKLDRPYLNKNQLRGNKRNVYDEVKDYSDSRVETLNRYNDILRDYTNVKMIINNTPFHSKHDQNRLDDERKELIEKMPVNDHYHPGKGRKTDVKTPYEERHPHIADRLGHPEIFLSPVESLLRVDRTKTHPTFLDQPFIQTPGADCEKNLDFEVGELIYEKSDQMEWNRFFHYGFNTFYIYWAFWYPYNIVCKASVPSSDILKQIKLPFIEYSFQYFDSYNIINLAYPFLFGVTIFTINRFINLITAPYVQKLQYNTNQDLIFATTTNMLGMPIEKVYEVDHLEIQAPALRSGTAFLDFSDKGLNTIICMNKDERIMV